MREDSGSAFHRVNEHVRRFAGSMVLAGEPGAAYDFLCKCGCMRYVRLTLEQYDALDGAPVLHATFAPGDAGAGRRRRGRLLLPSSTPRRRP